MDSVPTAPHFPDELTLLRALIDAVPDPIFCKDRQCRYVLTNRAGSKPWGMSEDEMIGCTVFDVPGLREHGERYQSDDLKVMETGVPILNHEEPFVDGNENQGWYLTSKFPLRNAKGEITGLVGIARDITERKRVERRLADERQMLQTVLDAIPDPVFFKDTEGRHVLFNRANEEFHGVSKGNYLGKTAAELNIPREIAAGYMRDDEQVLKAGRAILNREEPYLDRNGRAGWYLTSKLPLFDAAGAIVGLVGICRDISERKEADRLVNEERTFLKTLMDAIPDLIFFKDREGRHLHINATDKKTFGIDDRHGLGKTVYEWPIPTEIADLYAADDRYVIETGEPIVNREEPFELPDGRRGWFLTSKLPIRDAEGNITGLVGISRDITQLKIDREELERTRTRLLDHLENSPMAIIEWRPGFLDRWAGRAEAIFGWKPEEVVGKHFSEWQLVHPDDLPMVTDVAARLTGRIEERNVCRNRNFTRDGRTIHCVWHNSVLHDSEGGAVSIMSLVQDVTEQVEAAEVARRGEAERAELERQLLESQKLESLGVLAGGIAHDFNNLLTGVLGNATLAAGDLPPDSHVHEYLHQIEAAAIRAAELCKQMLAYSGRGRFVVRRLSLNSLIEETTGLLNSSLHRGAQLTFDLMSDLPPVLVDETQIRQIVMNLVINASEALNEIPGVICIRTSICQADHTWRSRAHAAPDFSEGPHVLLEITDTGAGMTPDVMARVFEPFFTTKFTGRGLGMAAVLGIVRGHHGAIRLTSTKGQGTRFQILLPVAEGTVETKFVPDLSRTWRGTGRILVIDDEVTVGAIASRMLESMGFEVVVVADGEAGVEAFRSDPGGFVAVLLDLTMPRHDGAWTYQEVARSNPNVNVIVMSGFNAQEVAARFGKKGPLAFIEKPFKMADLRDALQRVLEWGGES